LWRKIFPDELNKADHQLSDHIYGFLNSERWRTARGIGDFAMSVPNLSDPIRKRMILVNYVIALKFGGKAEEAKKMLSSMDWSDTPNDFKLAHAVLSDSYDEAASLMRRIGAKGDYVNEQAYHIWPLFREFRQTEEFLQAYEDIYGYAFVVELQRSTNEAIAKAEEKLEEKKQELEAAVETNDETGSQSNDADDILNQTAIHISDSATS
jgi:predicted RNase H-like nuclease